MPVNGDGTLRIFLLSVGQADTSLIITPEGRIIVIDAVNPAKIISLLDQLGHTPGPGGEKAPIEKLIITHPHRDHFSGANRLFAQYKVNSLTVSPFWNELGMGPPTYRRLLNTAEEQKADIEFIAGYSRYYPDGALDAVNSSFVYDEDAFYLELLGPPNSLIKQLERDRKLDTNHLSIISRIRWKRFSLILAADAQMENWSFYDREGMLSESCNILKSAHHGSCNGTQWERLERLSPKYTIVSSDPNRGHGLPDLVGTSIFHKYASEHPREKVILLTSETGSLNFTVRDGTLRESRRFGEPVDSDIDLGSSYALTWTSNETNWSALLEARTLEVFHN